MRQSRSFLPLLTALCFPAWCQQGPQPLAATDKLQRRIELRQSIEMQRATSASRDVQAHSLSPEQRSQLREELRRQSVQRSEGPPGAGAGPRREQN